MDSVIKNMYLDIVLQASFVKAVVLQVKKNGTITAKKKIAQIMAASNKLDI